MRTAALAISLTAHTGIVLVAVFGGPLFSPEPAETLEVVDIQLLSAEEFAALSQGRTEPSSPEDAPRDPTEEDAAEDDPVQPEPELQDPAEEEVVDVAAIEPIEPIDLEEADAPYDRAPDTPSAFDIAQPEIADQPADMSATEPLEGPRIVRTPSLEVAAVTDVSSDIDRAADVPAAEDQATDDQPIETAAAARSPEQVVDPPIEEAETPLEEEPLADAARSLAALAAPAPRRRPDRLRRPTPTEEPKHVSEPEQVAEGEPEQQPEREDPLEVAEAVVNSLAPSQSAKPRRRPILARPTEPEVAKDTPRIDPDLLAKLSEALGDATLESDVAAAPVLGPPLSLNEKDGFRLQLKRCWRKPDAGGTDPSQLIVVLRAQVARDGTIIGVPLVERPRGAITPRQEAAVRSARRALLGCAPLRLPPAKYQRWKDLRVTFDPVRDTADIF